MSFGVEHYVPVLKVKRGEKTALQLIGLGKRDRITPLFEIVERTKKPTIEAHLDTAFKGLADSLRGYPRYFLDAREVEPDGEAGARKVFSRASALAINFTPVTGISRVADVQPALAHADDGLALRLTRAEFEAGGMAGRVRSFLAGFNLDPERIDLIVDLGPVDDLIVDGVSALSSAFLQEVPDPEAWRTLTLSACSFPRSMGVVERKSHATVERSEWRSWKRIAGTSVARVPTYSDCAIQHPVGVEGFDPRVMQVSASVRYTLEDDWLLVKGVSTRRRPARQQFPELAKHLVYGYLRQHFAGAGHCEGCAAVKSAADGGGGFGSAEVWRRIGTVHHLTVVTQALRSWAGS